MCIVRSHAAYSSSGHFYHMVKYGSFTSCRVLAAASLVASKVSLRLLDLGLLYEYGISETPGPHRQSLTLSRSIGINM